MHVHTTRHVYLEVFLNRSRNQPPWDGLGVLPTPPGQFISQFRGKLSTIFPIRFSPRFTPGPLVKNISQQHHYVEYAYIHSCCRTPRPPFHQAATPLRTTRRKRI